MTIQAIKLVKRFGGHMVVDNVDFDVKDGEFVALLGPSGGGKSTVLRIVAGLEVPDSGSVLIGGKEVTRARVQDRGFGFVFQHYALFKNMSVRDNIGFGLSVRKVPKQEMHDRVTELLELVQMKGFDDRYPSQLSGGQRQRVALARALAPRPALLLLDEPFGALDAKVRVELRGWLRRLQREHGITSVFVTHDQEEAMELADRVVIIHEGRVEQVGTPEEVYDHPATAFVASFVGMSNVLTGVVEKGRAALGPMEVSAPGAAKEGSDVRAYVRHHQVEVVGRADELTPAGLARAKVRRVSRIGWVAKLDLLVDGGQALVAEMPKNRLDELGIAEGDQVTVNLRQASVFVDEYVSDYVI